MPGEDRAAFTIIVGFDSWGWLWSLEIRTNGRELGGAAGVRQKSEVTNTAESFRQHVEQEATDELVSVECHHLGLVVGAIILPAEADATILAGKEPTVGDRHAMSVAPQILEYLLRPCEGPLGVHDPFDIAQRPEMASEGRRFHEPLKLAEQHEFSFVERRLQALEEQTSIQCRQNMDGKEEIGRAADPAPTGREATARHDAVGMRMMESAPTIP